MASSGSTSFALHRLVFALDRSADKLLRPRFGVSHKRGLFLVAIQQGPMTQHELAVALGYTDPAVSAMLVELVKADYVTITPSPDHKRKRVVSLSPHGEEVVTGMRLFLDGRFNELLEKAGVDPRIYAELTDRIYQAASQQKEQ